MKNIILGILLFLSLILVFVKSHFEYYHFLFPLILIYALWLFERRKKKSVRRKILVGGLLLLNICILFISDSLLYKKINSELYYWTEQKLTVNHFKGKPDNTSEHTATVFPSMVGKISRVYNYPSYVILAADKNNDSWIKKELYSDSVENLKKMDSLLNHEKRHLDLTEIYNRKAIDSIDNLVLPSYQLKYDIVEYFFKISDSVNDEYDKETEHGANSKIQLKWDNYIDSRLNME